jgi:hypothetical protein
VALLSDDAGAPSEKCAIHIARNPGYCTRQSAVTNSGGCRTIRLSRIERLLLTLGCSEDDVSIMIQDNPAALLGLNGQG